MLQNKRFFQKLCYKFCILVLLLSYINCGFAKIIETKNISDILNYVNEHTLLVFDLDNTLIDTKQTLGNDAWFTDHLNRLIAEGFTTEVALEKTLKYYDPIHDISEVEPVDPKTPEIIKNFQEKGIITLGLTTRGSRIKEATVRQLSTIPIHFNAMPKNQDFFSLESAPKGIIYAGIIFTGGAKKGPCLIEYLERLQLKPKQIVFIDDKLGHVESVQKALEKRGIEFVGFHYRYMDPKVAAYNREIASIQLEYFNRILSDEDAEAIYHYRNKKGN